MKQGLKGLETFLEVRVAACLMQHLLILFQLFWVIDLIERGLAEPILEIKVESCLGNKISKEWPLILGSCQMRHSTHIVISTLDICFAFIQ